MFFFFSCSFWILVSPDIFPLNPIYSSISFLDMMI